MAASVEQQELNRHLSQELARANQRIQQLAGIVQGQEQRIAKLAASIDLRGVKYYPATDLAKKIAAITAHVKQGQSTNPFSHLDQKSATSLCYLMYRVGRQYFWRIFMLDPKWGEHAFCNRFPNLVGAEHKLQAIARFIEEHPWDFERV